MSRAFSAVFALLLALSVPTVAAAEGPVTQFLKGKHEQVNKLLKQYRDMRSMMRKINSAGGLEAFGQGMLGGR